MNKIKIQDFYSGNRIDFKQLKDQGFTGLIFKAGQGMLADIPRLRPTLWNEAKEWGFDRGWYWLRDCRYRPSLEVEALKRATGDIGWGELGMWADAEKPTLTMLDKDYWIQPYPGWERLYDFMYGVQKLNMSKFPGSLPGLYTSPGHWNLIANRMPLSSQNWFAQAYLWIAQYPYVYIPWISKPTMFGTWKKWNLWQWRAEPDINQFNGTDEEYNVMFGKVVEEIPPVVPPTVSIISVKLTDVYGTKEFIPGSTDGSPKIEIGLSNGTGSSWMPKVIDEEVPPVEEDDNVEVSGKKYGIVVHRREWDPDWLKDMVNSQGNPVYMPETVPMQDIPRYDGKGERIDVTPEMFKAFDYLNRHDPRAQRYVRSVNAMWINTPYDPAKNAKAEKITNSHNFVQIIGETPSHWEIACFDESDKFMELFKSGVDWYRRPDIIFKAGAACYADHHIKVVSGVDVYFPLIKTMDHLYLPKTRVEVFPTLPFKATTRTILNIREKPGVDNKLLEQYKENQEFDILEYRPLGASVWGRTNIGWVCLLISEVPTQRYFTTNWSLRTNGVIPPTPVA